MCAIVSSAGEAALTDVHPAQPAATGAEEQKAPKQNTFEKVPNVTAEESDAEAGEEQRRVGMRTE